MTSELRKEELDRQFEEEEDEFDFSDTDEGVIKHKPNAHDEVAQVMNSVKQSQMSGICSQQESAFSSLKTNHMQATAFQSSQNYDTLVNPKSSVGNFSSLSRLGKPGPGPQNLKSKQGKKSQPGLPRGRRNTHQTGLPSNFLSNNKENFQANTQNVSGMNQTLTTQNSNHFERTYDKMVKQKVLGGASMKRKSSRTASQHDVKQFTERMAVQEQQRVAKIENLKQMNSSKDLIGCTFKPQTSQTRKKSINRQPQQFIQDQQKREEQRQRMLQELQEQQTEHQQSILNPRPQINKKSQQILERTKTPRAPVHERLNNKERSLSALGQRKKSLARDTSASFRPNIHKKSQNLKRPQPVADILYQDAQKRKQRNQERSLLKQQMEQEALQQNQIPKVQGSEKYVVQKFTKELVTLWQNMQIDESNQENETMNYIILKDFMQKTGFFAGDKGSKGIQIEEHEMFIEIWKQLGGKERTLITLNNLRIFLFAIMGTFIEPNLDRKDQKLVSIPEAFGQLNEHGDLFLNREDIPQIQKCFHKLYLNRMQFEGKRQRDRKSEKQGQVDFTFKPQINEVSRVIAKNYQSRIMNDSIQNSTFDRLANPRDQEAWREEAKKILVEEEMRDCTFKPETNVPLTERSRQGAQRKQLPPKAMVKKSTEGSLYDIGLKKRSIECNTSLGIRTDEPEIDNLVQKPYTSSSKAQKTTPNNKLQQETEIFKQGLQLLSQEMKYEDPVKQQQHQTLERPESKVSFQTHQEQSDPYRSSTLEFPTELKNQREGFISNEQPCIQLQETEMEEMTEGDDQQQYFQYANQALLDESHQTQSSIVLKEQFPFQKEQMRLADLQLNESSSAGNTPLPEPNQQPSFNRYQSKEEEEEEEEVLDETSSFKNYSEEETIPVKKNIQILDDDEASDEKMPLIFVDVNLGPARQERIIVFEGDEAHILANQFCCKHGLSEETEERLVELLQMQIEKASQK